MHCVWSTGALTSNTLCVSFFPQYASKGHEYFNVYSPEIATTYGENYWTSMGVHPLPDHIVKRFKGKVIAITGYEMDQVMVEPVGQPGVHHFDTKARSRPPSCPLLPRPRAP